ncbi:hypothetical protein ACHAQJ_001586 [Trichoderma viride]
MAANDATVFVFLYFSPAYFQFVHNNSDLEAAIRLLPAVDTGLTIQIGYAVAALVVEPNEVGDAIIIPVTGCQEFGKNTCQHNFSNQDIGDAVSGAQSTLFQHINGELRDQAVNAITQAIEKALILLPAGGGVLLVAALFMKRERLFGEIVA